MSLENQQSYLEKISKQSIIPTLENQIDEAKTLLEQYQNQLLKFKIKTDYGIVEQNYSTLKDLYYADNLKRDQREYENTYNSLNWNALGIDKIELSDFLKLNNRTLYSSGFYTQFRDEARHGKAFEGLLNRYFG